MKISPAASRRPRKIKTAWAGFGVLTALVMSLLFTRHATRHGAQEPQLEATEARADVLAREGIAPVRNALVNSLWGDYAVPTCRVGAVWGDGRQGEGVRGAVFSATMRLTVRAPIRTPAAAVHAATWVAREKIELEAANDADIAARYVSVEPGAAPVVRIFRAARFRQRQTQVTATAFAAQSGLRLAA